MVSAVNVAVEVQESLEDKGPSVNGNAVPDIQERVFLSEHMEHR